MQRERETRLRKLLCVGKLVCEMLFLPRINNLLRFFVCKNALWVGALCEKKKLDCLKEKKRSILCIPYFHVKCKPCSMRLCFIETRSSTILGKPVIHPGTVPTANGYSNTTPPPNPPAEGFEATLIRFPRIQSLFIQ